MRLISAIVFSLIIGFVYGVYEREYYGKFMGSFKTLAHQVRGQVYAINSTHIFIKDFFYDGLGPAAVFWVGNSRNVDESGQEVPDFIGRTGPLKGSTGSNRLLILPRGLTINRLSWLSVWCKKFVTNFGYINITKDFLPPEPVDLGPIRELSHSTRAQSVIVLDPKTLFIKKLHNDGAAPDAFFLAGNGTKPHGKGVKIPDENGSLSKIHGYAGADITLRLPPGLTIFDVQWFALFCITYDENFGNVIIPSDLDIPPQMNFIMSKLEPFMSCIEIFPSKMQASWQALNNEEIAFELEGKVDPNHYLSFGLSGDHRAPTMIGADVAVAYFDKEDNQVRVEDYLLKHKSQCSTKGGACPDTESRGGSNDIQFLGGSYVDGVLKAIYKRRLITGDRVADQAILLNSPATIVAAIGPINAHKLALYHNIAYTKATDKPIRIQFGENRTNTCRHYSLNESGQSAPLGADSAASKSTIWKPAIIKGVNSFRVQMGPVGGDRGYSGITGSPAWGLAYWVNGKLIPEIYVKRGQNYTFIIETGDDENNPPQYHPLYITNNNEGAGSKTPKLLGSPNHRIYAGVDLVNGRADPSPGAGRFCEFKPISGIDESFNFDSIDEYKKTLKLSCVPGQPAILYWTPDENTPDLVYYQCFTHLNMGWKIHVSAASSNTNHVMLILILGFILFFL